MTIAIQHQMFEQQPWEKEALCPQTNPEIFFPEARANTESAKLVCASCEVQEQCLRWAIETNQTHGIWGGKTMRERRKIAKGKPIGKAKGKTLSRDATILSLHEAGVRVATLARQHNLDEAAIWRIIERTKKRQNKPTNGASECAAS